MEKARIGVIGCGCISGIYLKNLCTRFHNTTVAAVADLIPERAENAAREYGIPKILTDREMCADPDIDIILNITTPPDHYALCKMALEAGKPVHTEKPLSVKREQGAELLALAESKGLLLGGAPDTFMGAGIQTARKLVDDGWIGDIIGATAFMTCHGHESWHPDHAFYYKTGAGPLFEPRPYYLTALANLIGPVAAVTAEAKTTFPVRTITSAPHYGETIDVEVSTHYSSTLTFENGAYATVLMSFDVWGADLPRIELYGTRGTISVPDPNTFGGEVKVFLSHTKQWETVPLTHPYADNSRGLALADMACALREGRENRASGRLAFHVLDTMHAIDEAAALGRRVEVKSTCGRPAPMDPEWNA